MDIEELKRLAMAATPGPWFAEASWQSTLLEGRHDGKWAVRSSKKSHGFSPLAYVKGDKRITGGDGSLNAQFIAAARDAVPELIAEVERVTKQRDELLAALKIFTEVVDRPQERYCSCHISPPCNDCVENSGLREAFSFADAAIAKVEG